LSAPISAHGRVEPWSSVIMSIQSTGLSDWESAPAPLTVTFQTAKKLSGLGLTTLWKLVKEKRIEIVRIGGRSLITYRSLLALLTPTASEAPPRRGRPRKPPQAELPTPRAISTARTSSVPTAG
jgi:hypothetical protein